MTGPAVDLAAVRSARTALAAIVAEHPELTGATARARLAANLSEIIAMKPLDPNATGKARTITVRLTADLIARLEAERDRLAVLVPGSSLGLSDAVRSFILRSGALPSTSSPAPSPAPAPMRPVGARVEAVEPPAVDPRQLPLLAAASPVVSLHNAANGANVATITGNDNATSTPKPKRARRAAPVEAPELVDLDALKARLAAAVVAGHTLKALSREGKFSDSSVVMWRNGRRASIGPEVAAKLDAVVTSHGF